MMRSAAEFYEIVGIPLVITEAIIVGIEAWSYYDKVGLPKLKAFTTSLAANTCSFVIGLVAMMILPSFLDLVNITSAWVRGIVYVLAGLLVIEAIEVPIVMAMNREQVAVRVRPWGVSVPASRKGLYEYAPGLIKTVEIVNLITYVLLLLALYAIAVLLSD